MPGGQTVTVTFLDDSVEVWIDCANIQDLTNPARLRFIGPKGGTTGTWTIPFSSIKHYSVS
ncbi:MAG: hypothetical protein FJZ00_05795 [Candidatus Sericytochromatia bacterium]|uniref:Uncharacterized protein n=1 Tax=Candidatus Tanganyikabacteria bacterium TaxID=2961651 RepID=A0A937X4I1_9BACT|nr:hypothetical protein [Candidatus Tanganyikabacteria bacterium]